MRYHLGLQSFLLLVSLTASVSLPISVDIVLIFVCGFHRVVENLVHSRQFVTISPHSHHRRHEDMNQVETQEKDR